MAIKKRGLGTGLDILLSRPLILDKKNDGTEQISSREEIREISLTHLFPSPFQPRQHFDEQELEELAQSMKTQGVIQPVIARASQPDGQGNGLGERFELIAGERRWRAAKKAGLATIPVRVRVASDQEVLLMALVENMMRTDLNPLEEARGLYRLLDEFGLTHQEAADLVGRSRSQVSNTLRLLSLAESVKKLLSEGLLEMGHARAMLALRPEWQTAMAERVISEGWTVRKTEQEVSKWQAQKKDVEKRAPSEAVADPNIEFLKRQLSDRWGLSVDIQTKAKGKGKLVIHYEQWSDLEPFLGQWDFVEEES